MSVFFVFERQPPNTADYKSSVLLIKDHWDDWFKYETQFFMSYVDMMGESHDIGAVKIGQENMEKGQRSPALPVQFNQLPADCFSLGQSDFYYENINHLGDGIREQILTNMRDLAYDPDLYAVVRNQEVTRISLMRDVTHFMITHQYQRIAKGNARLTNYEIEYTYPVVEGLCETKLNFNIVPDSNPPTNIHVVIGRNNVGKTYLIKNILSSIYSIDDGIDHGILRATNDSTGRLVRARKQVFANVLCVSFSPFDNYSDILYRVSNKKAMPFTYIGLRQTFPSTDNITDAGVKGVKDAIGSISLSDILSNDFYKSLKNCIHSQRKLEMLNKTISVLESDPVFARSDLKHLIDVGKSIPESDLQERTGAVFKRLSSGHQVIMLTLVQLIAYLTERTFVILDEPENHLHPPLLAAFIRALSELLISYNGVALIATHSPVILQEVPRKCAWKLNRNGNEVTVSRLEIESFGATIGALTREVFGLEVRQSGFHKMLCDEVNKGLGYGEIKDLFHNELGDEALALLRTLLALRDEDKK